jgi:hypothetical protein
VPFGTSILGSNVFADDQCKTFAYTCPGSVPRCEGTAIISTGVDANGEVRAVALNAAKGLPVVYTISDAQGTCGPANFAPIGFYQLGAALPWDAYPSLTEINGRPSGAP